MVSRALARYLATQSLVTLDESGATGNCYLEVMAPGPDTAVCLKATGGNAPIGSAFLGYDEPTISVTVRGRVAARDGRFVVEPGRGRFLPREPDCLKAAL